MKPPRSPIAVLPLALTLLAVLMAGCRRQPDAAARQLPPAYPRNQINDPALRDLAADLHKWSAQQVGSEQRPLYSRSEILPPVPTVQPYGVGVFQQERRLPVILTIGPGWHDLKAADKEARVREAFEEISRRLHSLPPPANLQPTLSVQTPQGMELAWINHLDPSGKNLHGDE